MSAFRITPQLRAALEYAGRGWAVHPLRGKVPYLPSWQTRATTDSDRIRQLWRKYPDANVGITTGRRSGLVVLDVDNKNGKNGSRSLQLLEQEVGPLPSTLTVTTPHGRHFYFELHESSIPNSVGRLGAGLDVKSDGGYVVAPPSVIHGVRYAWARASASVIAVPDSLAIRMRLEPKRLNGPLLSEGFRNDDLFRLGCAMRGRGVSDALLLSALQVINERHCTPPLPASEIQTIYRSILTYPMGDAGRPVMLPLAKLDGRPIPIEWLSQEPEPMEFLVQDWIPRGSVALLVAEGGTGKTMLAMRLAVAVATGTPWLGLETKRGRVLYLGMEDPDRELRRRLWKMIRHEETQHAQSPGNTFGRFLKRLRRNLHMRSLVGAQFHLVQQKGNQAEQSDLLGALIERLRPYGYRFIVLDPMSRLHGGDENSNSFGTTVINAIERLALELDATVLVPHHTGKGNASTRNKDAYSARGASAIADATRVVMRLASDKLRGSDRLRLMLAKGNYGPPQSSISIRRDEGDLFAAGESADLQQKEMLEQLRQWSEARDHRPMFQRTIHEFFAEIFQNQLSRRQALAVFNRAIDDRHLTLTARGDNPKSRGYTFSRETAHMSRPSAAPTNASANIDTRVGDTSCPDGDIRRRNVIKKSAANRHHIRRKKGMHRTPARRRGDA